MSKKLYAAFVPLLAVAAFAVLPAVAQAQPFPHWYSNGTRIPAGTRVIVTTEGSPTLTLHGLGNEITCKVVDDGWIENPVGGGAGINSILSFTNSACKAANEEALPKGCPKPEIIALRGGKALSETNEWPSTLLVGPPIRDEIREIEVEVICSGTAVDLFHGSLTPKIGNSIAEFGAGSGELEDSMTPINKATVTGNDDLTGPPGDEKITAKTP